MTKQTLSCVLHSQTNRPRPRHSSRKVYIAVRRIIIRILITMKYEESFATLPEGDTITQLLKKSFAARNVSEQRVIVNLTKANSEALAEPRGGGDGGTSPPTFCQ